MIARLRLAFRIARREALRYKGRSVLSIVLLGLPLLGASLFATAYDTAMLSPVEVAELRIGEADAFLQTEFEGVPVVQQTWTERYGWTEPVAWAELGPDEDLPEVEEREVAASEILSALPEGSSIAPYSVNGLSGSIRVETPDGIGGLDTAGYDLSDPMYELAGLEYIDGGAPEDDQIVISEAAADYLEIGVGDEVELSDGSADYTVSGVVEIPWNLGGRYAIGTVFPGGASGWLVDSPGELTFDDALALNELGFYVWSTPFVENPPAEEELTYVDVYEQGYNLMVYGLIATAVVLEVVLLAGPAFAISARRRAREFALMSASGAAPGHLRMTVLAGGLLFGVIAAAGALAVGILAVWALTPVLEGFLGYRVAGLRVMPLMQGLMVGVAIAIGLLSALAAAISAGRVNVVAALSGRTPQRKARKRWLFLGLALVGGGVAAGLGGVVIWSTPLMAAAIVGLQLGLVCCTPSLVALVSKLGRWMPLAPRMALREAGRNRGSTAPAIAAVMGVVAAGIAFSLTVTADELRRQQWQPHELPQGSLSATIYDENFYATEAGAEPLDFEAAFTRVEQVLSNELDDLEYHKIDQYSCPAETDETEDSAPGEAEVFTETYCDIGAIRPESNICVYWEMMPSTEAETVAAVEAAREDPRCDETMGTYGVGSDAVVGSTDPEIVAAYTGLEGAELDRAVELLESGGVLVSDPWAITDDDTVVVERRVETFVESGDQPEPVVNEHEFPTMAVDKGLLGYNGLFIGPAAAEEMGLVEYGWSHRYLLESSTEIDSALQERIAASLDGISGEGMYASVSVTDYRDDFYFYLMLAVAILSGVIALGATAVSTGLIIAESKSDMTTLGAVGAEPRVRKRFAMWQTIVIALLGAGLGTVAGLIGYALIREALNQGLKGQYPWETLYGWELPWVNFGISLLAVPLVAALGAILFTKARLPSERRLT